MKIGFDARLIHWPGIGRYIQALIHYMPLIKPQHEYIFYFSSNEDCQLYGNPHPCVKNYVISAPVFSLKEQWQWPRHIRKDGLHLFHAAHYVAPLMISCPLVVTIHDLVGFRYPTAVFSHLARLYMQGMTRAAVRKATHLIADSHFTCEEIQSLLSVRPEKITVNHLGVNPDRFAPSRAELGKIREKYGLPDQYILYVGTKKPWKNLPVLLLALKQMVDNGETIKLVLAGKDAQHQIDLSQTIQDLGLRDCIIEIGYIGEEELTTVYAMATMFVLPSYYEGFGLPALEAMAVGTPVVASQAASLPELVGKAGLLVNPHDPANFATALTRVLHDPELRATMRRKGPIQAHQFTWEACAAKTIAVYEKVQNP